MKNEASKQIPLVSIIVLTYLQRHILNDCIDSILSQDYPNIELIICDDCSADFDCDEVYQYIEQNKKSNISNIVIYKHADNVGTVMNAQKGVELSSGEFFKLHAGDDMLYEDDSISRAMKYFQEPQTMIIAGISRACQHDGTLTDHYYPAYEARVSMMNADAYRQFEMMGTQSWGEYINAPAVYWRRKLFDQMGGFDLQYKYTEDWPMWLKITKSGIRITVVDEIFTVYRYGGISNDQSVLNLDIGKMHYMDCIHVLREQVLPVFVQAGNKKKITRCRHAIKCIEVRKETEGEWANWSAIRRIIWRIKNRKFLFVSWAYRKRKYGITLPKKKLGLLLGGLIILYKLNINTVPFYVSNIVWSYFFFAVMLYTILQIGIWGLVKIMNVILDIKRG